MSVIEAKKLELTFQTNDGPVHALADVNLEIAKGDFVSFIGPSGCGKTTFLRCIAGLETAMARVTDEPFTMPSGGGHDAAIFAQAGIPAGMVFVRNRNGSHNPEEAMEIGDFLVGTAILSAYLEAEE